MAKDLLTRWGEANDALSMHRSTRTRTMELLKVKPPSDYAEWVVYRDYKENYRHPLRHPLRWIKAQLQRLASTKSLAEYAYEIERIRSLLSEENLKTTDDPEILAAKDKMDELVRKSGLRATLDSWEELKREGRRKVKHALGAGSE